MTANAILDVLATSGDPMTLEKLRRRLSHIALIALRYHLARLEERGAIERINGAYRLAASTAAPSAFAEDNEPPILA